MILQFHFSLFVCLMSVNVGNVIKGMELESGGLWGNDSLSSAQTYGLMVTSS